MVKTTDEVNRTARAQCRGATTHLASPLSRASRRSCAARTTESAENCGASRCRRSLARARPRWPSMPRVAAPAAAAAASPRLKGGRLGEGSGAGTAAMLGLRRLL